MATEDCPRDCPMAQRIIVLEETEKRHGETHKEIFGRINKLETENAVQNTNHAIVMDTLKKMEDKNDKLLEKVDTIRECVAAQVQAVSEMNERGKQNKARLDALEAEPGKRWKDIVKTVIGGVVTILLGYIALKLGLSG